MRRRTVMLLAAVVVVDMMLVQEVDASAAEVSLKDLPGCYLVEFRPDPYIKAAIALQGMGKKRACKRLAELAKEEQRTYREGWRVSILCRMLFTAKPGGKFRGPHIGVPAFLGGTDYPDWPLEPIEIVDGVPFRIVWGYSRGGRGELPSTYVDYCLNQCDWSSIEYAPKTADEKARALKKLLGSKKWKTPLTAYEKDFLTQQIK
jgi:hypothetical protein